VITGLVLLLKHRDDIQDDYYDKPYTRVTPFGVGILLGIMFVDKELVNRTIHKPWNHILMAISVLVRCSFRGRLYVVQGCCATTCLLT
jgi:hypothetical protein